MTLLLAILALVVPQSQVATKPTAAADADIPVIPVRIVRRIPHDPTAFTEGLVFHDGALFESVGREGQSDVRRVRLADGHVTARATIPAAQFGEGLAAWRGTLVSLTWHDGVAYRWDPRDLRRIGTARYPGEGWGLTASRDALILSDGTPTLRVLDPATFAERRRIAVTLRGKPLRQINELEMVDGAILANVWHSPFLVRIDAETGKVTAILDLRPLVAEIGASDPEAVANGIAWDAKARRLYVTGKLWPTLFEIAPDR